jgi:hypothetical protein
MYAIAVPDPNMEDSAYPNANQLIRNLNDFDLAYWGLPPF